MMTDEIKNKLCEIRGYQVILDFDLAKIFGIDTKFINQAVKRNSDLFSDNMFFSLTQDESSIFNQTPFPYKRTPNAFTVDGIIVLASLLQSKKISKSFIGLINVLKESKKVLGRNMKHVFISYVQEDRKLIDKIKFELEGNGIKVWIDRYNIQPGVDWRIAIKDAITNGLFFIACFSKQSSNKKESYMNEELSIAVDKLRRMPDDAIWFIPVKLNECKIPIINIRADRYLDSKQWIDLSNNWDNGISKIVETINNSA